MAIFSLQVKNISRSKGRSAMAASAYHSASKLHDIRTNTAHNYSKKDGVVKSDCFFFDGKEKITLEREQLWNIAEASESAVNARTAKEMVINIPFELDQQKREKLVDEFAISVAKSLGVAVDYSIHLPSDDGDNRNHHVHMMITTRTISKKGDGFVLGDKTSLELSNKKLKELGLISTQDQIIGLRQDWELLANEHLHKAGLDVRIDHRSNEDRGLVTLPTLKMGKTATSIERKRSKGLSNATSCTGDRNREIAEYNKKAVERANKQAADQEKEVELNERISRAIGTSQFRLDETSREIKFREQTTSARERKSNLRHFSGRIGGTQSEVISGSGPIEIGQSKIDEFVRARDERKSKASRAAGSIELRNATVAEFVEYRESEIASVAEKVKVNSKESIADFVKMFDVELQKRVGPSDFGFEKKAPAEVPRPTETQAPQAPKPKFRF